jgi:hypothetical protein
MKELYRFKTTIKQSVEKTEVKNENGQEITVKSKVEEPIEYNIILKKLARGETDAFRLFYGSQLKKAIDAGLITKAVLINKHIDGAGALLSKETAKRIAELNINIEKVRDDLVFLGETGEDQEKIDKQTELLAKLVDNQRELQAIENSNQVIFQNTAENYAQERANLWLIFNLTFVEKDGKVEPLFKGASFQEKEESYFDLEEKQDPLYNSVAAKIAIFWGFYGSNRASTKEDFEKIEKEYFTKESE